MVKSFFLDVVKGLFHMLAKVKTVISDPTNAFSLLSYILLLNVYTPVN